MERPDSAKSPIACRNPYLCSLTIWNGRRCSARRQCETASRGLRPIGRLVRSFMNGRRLCRTGFRRDSFNMDGVPAPWAAAMAKTGLSVAAGSGLDGPADANEPKCSILITLPKLRFVLPKVFNSLFFSVFSEGLIQPMGEGVAQIEVNKRRKKARTIDFGSLCPKPALAVVYLHVVRKGCHCLNRAGFCAGVSVQQRSLLESGPPGRKGSQPATPRIWCAAYRLSGKA